MRRFLFLFLLFPSLAIAQTSCVKNAPLAMGNGVTCTVASDNFQNSGQGAFPSVQVTFNPTAGNQSVVNAYFCPSAAKNIEICQTPPDWVGSTSYSSTAGTSCGIAMDCIVPTANNPCGFPFYATTTGTSSAMASEPTWSTTPCQSSAKTITDNNITWGRGWLQPADGNNTQLSCFTWAPNSPAFLQTPYTIRGYINYQMYCPSIPTLAGGVLRSLCMVGTSNSTACTALGLMASAYTGLCTTAPCIDQSTFGSTANSSATSLSLTTGTTTATNEMVFFLGGTVNDEALSNSGGCAYISEGNANGLAPKDANIVSFKTTSSLATQTCGQTWTGADAGGAMIMTVKTAQSGGGGGGVTRTAASCNFSDVNSVVNASSDGDTVIVPAGSCAWTATQGIVVPASIGISILGNGNTGQNSAANLFGASAACTSGTTITKSVGAASSAIFTMNPNATASLSRISCFNLVNSGTSAQNSANPIGIAGTCAASGCPNVRIDNIHAPTSWSNGMMLGNAIGVISNMFGVLDHNSIGDASAPTEANLTFVDTGNGSWQGLGSYGDQSWFSSDTFGTNQSLYLENNLFNFALATDSEAPGTNFGGARIVCRFNSFANVHINGMCSGHGTETTGRPRGTRQWEAYYNTGQCNIPDSSTSNRGCGSAWPGRSGVGLSFANSFTNDPTHPAWILKGLVTATAQRVGRQVGTWGTCSGVGPNQEQVPPLTTLSTAALPFDSTDGTPYFTGTIGTVTGNGSFASPFVITPSGASPNWSANQWVAGTFIYILRDDTLAGSLGVITTNNAGTLTVGDCGPCLSPAANDHITIRKITACLDQPGRSGGNLMAGNYSPPSSPPQAYPFLTSTNASGPINEVIDPIYEAADSLPSTVNGTIASQAGNLMISGRDWYSEGVGQPAQTSTSSPFNGAVSSQPITALNCVLSGNSCTYNIANTTGFAVNGYAAALGTAPGTIHPTTPTGGYGKITAVVANTSVTLQLIGVSDTNDNAGAGGFLVLQGAGHGTFANMPTTCTPSVGYWATDQGTWNNFNSSQVGQLYICSAPNTWTLSYTPFTYPHPLISGAGSPVGSLSPTSLAFGNQPLALTSASQTFTFTNTGGTVLTISTITISGDYSQTNNCPFSPPLGVGASCTFTVTFTPTVLGSRPGSITITSNASNNPSVETLTGTGTAPIFTGTAKLGGTQIINNVTVTQ